MLFSRAAIFAAALTLPGIAFAHDSYIQLRFGEWTLVNAHGADEDDSYGADKVANIGAHDGKGAEIAVETVDRANYTAFAPAEGTAAIAATYVSGFWVKDTDGEWHNTSKDQVANPESAGEYARHAVALIDEAEAYAPFGLPLEIVPMSDPLHMHPGDKLTVQVLSGGEPLAGVEIGSALPGVDPVTTDDSGKAEVTVREGHNILRVGHKMDHPQPEKADTLSYEATLSFAPHHEH